MCIDRVPHQFLHSLVHCEINKLEAWGLHAFVGSMEASGIFQHGFLVWIDYAEVP